MSDKYTRLLDYLAKHDGWATATELADHLGVTTRSVRSYVTAAKSAAHPLPVILSSTVGYRLNREAFSIFAAGGASGSRAGPEDRVRSIARRLAELPSGIDVYSLAGDLYVSESTIEADLRKVRNLAQQNDLSLSRQGNTVRLVGSESNLRRLLSSLFHAEGADGFPELDAVQREFDAGDLSAFKTDLIAMLDVQGYFVNEYGVASVIVHIAIAVDRARRDKRLSTDDTVLPDATQSPVPAALAELVTRHFEVALDVTDLVYLSRLLTTRVVTPTDATAPGATTDLADLEANLHLVREVMRQVADEYLVDLSEEAFMQRLALHVGNLVARAQDNSYSRNPLGRSIKTAYPMIYDVAVFIASQIQRARSITINDDEISYIALHLGSYLQRQSRREKRLTCAIVCPGYYDVHAILRQDIEDALGDDLSVEVVVTRSDVAWEDFTTDVVLTTIQGRTSNDRVVVIQPFLTPADVERARRAISRIRRQGRRARIKEDLLRYFDPKLFLRNIQPGSEAELIAGLGAMMVERGIIDESYVTAAIERERMSSTAFTETIAVPHAMTMTANRTAIAISINETPIPWGENRVNVIALVAFSPNGRESFQTVFDQLVEVFANRTEVSELIRRSVDFTTFINELVHLIDE